METLTKFTVARCADCARLVLGAHACEPSQFERWVSRRLRAQLIEALAMRRGR